MAKNVRILLTLLQNKDLITRFRIWRFQCVFFGIQELFVAFSSLSVYERGVEWFTRLYMNYSKCSTTDQRKEN